MKQNELISNNGGLKCIGVDGKRNKNTMVQETRIVNGQEQVKQMRKHVSIRFTQLNLLVNIFVVLRYRKTREQEGVYLRIFMRC